jgi:hypothetical protein
VLQCFIQHKRPPHHRHIYSSACHAAAKLSTKPWLCCPHQALLLAAPPPRCRHCLDAESVPQMPRLCLLQTVQRLELTGT